MQLTRLQIIGVSEDEIQPGAQVLILAQQDDITHKLMIPIGDFEAWSISAALRNNAMQRPLTHDLFKNFAETLNVTVEKAIIYKMVDGIFYSNIVFKQGGKEYLVDARTSDAIAIAVRFKAPIYTDLEVMRIASVKQISELGSWENFVQKVQEKQLPNWKSYLTNDLQNLMQEAVEKENYEEAAQIRDEINRRKNI